MGHFHVRLSKDIITFESHNPKTYSILGLFVKRSKDESEDEI